jgi:hypothetical protein
MNVKRIVLAIAAVFAVWSMLDFVIHGEVLASAYMATPQLWRPMPEMKMGLMYATMILIAAAFVLIYARLITDKSVRTGLEYGVLFGAAAGLAMGYGSYSVMPITPGIAFGWFLGTFIKYVVAGWVTALIAKK